MGAAGRDFHNFNAFFRSRRDYEVVAFTATQIPNIEGRRYPPALAGRLYPKGIPIYPESRLEELVRKLKVDQVVFSYSDVSHERVMHLASKVIACGTDFRLMGTRHTAVRAKVPVVTVAAVRTGCGKSQTTRKVAQDLKAIGYRRVVVVRHPMPYGDLERQSVQRFETLEDIARHDCTIEEREEYEPHIRRGTVVYAGVDYEKILRRAEREADVVVWDGGNNDLPFYEGTRTLTIVVADPHRAGHEVLYHPGEANLRRADVVVINKISTARAADVRLVKKNIRDANPDAIVVRADSPIFVEDGKKLRRKRVLVIEDGPTLTHGGMAYGAGVIAARQYGAKALVDPRRYAVRSIKETFKKYPHIKNLLPAMGYGKKQVLDLEKTISRTPCDVVLIGTPVDLRRLLRIDKPAMRATYKLAEIGRPTLREILRKFGFRGR
jgi:predicted GTPase